MSSSGGLDLLSKAYPWIEMKPGSLVVDIGGSQGHVSAYLAEAFPSLHFIVQDLAEVISDTNSSYNIPNSVADRVKLMAHDFFTEQPVKDADVFFIRYTLHDWSDAYCVKILRSLIPALKSGAQIVVHDHMLPDPKTLSITKERSIRYASGSFLLQYVRVLTPRPFIDPWI